MMLLVLPLPGAVGGDEGDYLINDEEFDVDADSILHQSSDSD